MEQAIFSEQRGPRQRAVVEKDLIGKNASEILARAGISCMLATRHFWLRECRTTIP